MTHRTIAPIVPIERRTTHTTYPTGLRRGD